MLQQNAFANTKHVILVLSHSDLFARKCQEIDISCSFPNYTGCIFCFSLFTIKGGLDPNAALQHIMTRFVDLVTEKERSFEVGIICFKT